MDEIQAGHAEYTETVTMITSFFIQVEELSCIR